VEVDVSMFNYEIPLHFLKCNVRKRKEAHMRVLTSPNYYCRMLAVLITLLVIVSLLMLANLTSMLGFTCYLRVVMINVLTLISKLPTFSTGL